MTTSTIFAEDWAEQPFGKTLRVLIAVGGIITGTLVVLFAALASGSTWLLVLLGLTIGATSVRAAMEPSMVRLLVVLAAMVAVPTAGFLL